MGSLEYDETYRLARAEDFDLVHAFEGRPVVLFPALFEKKEGPS